MELFGNFTINEKSRIYKFNVSRVITWKLDFSVVRVVGEHLGFRSNEDVEAITFNNFEIPQFPQNIGKFFPNLKVLIINSCNLTNISKHDLMGLKQLKQLNLNGNFLTSLPNNLFENTPAIEAISMYGNRIEFIGRNVFDSLHKLSYVNLKMNLTIDVCSNEFSGVSFDQLKKIISKNCQAKILDVIDEFFNYREMKTFDDSSETLENYSFCFDMKY